MLDYKCILMLHYVSHLDGVIATIMALDRALRNGKKNRSMTDAGF